MKAKKFLGIVSPLGIGGLSLPIYVEGMAKADTGPMDADQQKTDKATWYHRGNSLEGGSPRHTPKNSPINPSHCGGHVQT